MRYLRFGGTGLLVTPVCLGTMNFGNQCDEPTSVAILDRALELGIAFIDTANNYPIGDRSKFGRTEEIIGRWLVGKRDSVVMASKCYMPSLGSAWETGNSRKNILLSVERSLRRLRTDYLDVLQLHAWDINTPIDETLRALDDLVRSGRVRYIGCANFRPHQLARSIGRAELLGTASFASIQWRYNLLYREAEHDLMALCDEDRIALLAYNPLAGGMLTGKHARGVPTAGGRFSHGTSAAVYAERYLHDRAFDLVDELAPIAADAGVSRAGLVLQWVLDHPTVTSALVGASQPGHLDEAVRAAEQPLDPSLRARLDDASSAFATQVDLSWTAGAGRILGPAFAGPVTENIPAN
jgi:1-deoxyxylulose-5-phosphate synthase